VGEFLVECRGHLGNRLEDRLWVAMLAILSGFDERGEEFEVAAERYDAASICALWAVASEDGSFQRGRGMMRHRGVRCAEHFAVVAGQLVKVSDQSRVGVGIAATDGGTNDGRTDVSGL
jgi:hypothetical protein